MPPWPVLFLIVVLLLALLGPPLVGALEERAHERFWRTVEDLDGDSDA